MKLSDGWGRFAQPSSGARKRRRKEKCLLRRGKPRTTAQRRVPPMIWEKRGEGSLEHRQGACCPQVLLGDVLEEKPQSAGRGAVMVRGRRGGTMRRSEKTAGTGQQRAGRKMRACLRRENGELRARSGALHAVRRLQPSKSLDPLCARERKKKAAQRKKMIFSHEEREQLRKEKEGGGKRLSLM